MPSLFQIGDDFLALNELLAELEPPPDPARSEGELNPAMEELFKEIEGNQGVKLDGYVNLIRAVEGDAAVMEAEAAEYKMKGEARRNRAKFLKDRLYAYMIRTGQAKVQTDKGRVLSIQNNGGAQAVEYDLLDQDDVAALPDRFKEVVVKIDTQAVKAALDAGESLDFAKLKPRGTHLRIK